MEVGEKTRKEKVSEKLWLYTMPHADLHSKYTQLGWAWETQAMKQL